MCGIAGHFDTERRTGAETMRQIAQRMGDALTHRGPDAGAVWVDNDGGVALAHRRLAIIDLSPAGAQPMASADGRYVIVYNGEIYNFPALADELRAAGHAISGGSDTAVLLAAIAAWGLVVALRKLNGIYAFAIWDKQTKTLALARDRLGVKPLYWAQVGKKIIFGSELRALLQHPDCPRSVDRRALVHYFRSGNVPSPRSILAGINKLAPAHCISFTPGSEPTQLRYWNLNQIATAKPASPPPYDVAVKEMHHLLRDAVRGQMLSDVPLGALLSGGIDSSVVTAMMQAQSDQPIKTFTIGFRQADFDEAPHARAIAAHLGTAHTETYVTDADARAIVPQLASLYDEPFADSSQIPTYLVSKIAREQVTVALSGDGGDEVFLGYNRYRAWEKFEHWPPLLRRAFGAACGLLPAELFNQLGEHLPPQFHIPQLGDKLVKFAALAQGDSAAVYRRLVSWWLNPDELVPGAMPEPLYLSRPVPRDPVAAMQMWDTLGYLQDDVLTKVDRASMAVALEARVPLLDHRVVEYSWRLPRSYKLQNGVTKRMLRDIAAHYLPPAILERPKSGFGVPLAAWLRGPLRPWAEELLTPQNLQAAGLNDALIRYTWTTHLANRGNHHHKLWTVLMYLAWRQEWGIED
jgi:asparagine synthase (glutamine-hydrolysing)